MEGLPAKSGLQRAVLLLPPFSFPMPLPFLISWTGVGPMPYPSSYPGLVWVHCLTLPHILDWCGSTALPFLISWTGVGPLPYPSSYPGLVHSFASFSFTFLLLPPPPSLTSLPFFPSYPCTICVCIPWWVH